MNIFHSIQNTSVIELDGAGCFGVGGGSNELKTIVEIVEVEESVFCT